VDENNAIILLQHQDRSRWNHALIQKGYEYLSLSSSGEYISVYHIESVIAAEHCLSKNFANTNWGRMLDLYDLLLTKKTIPTVILNRAIVLAHLRRIPEAIAEIEQIENIDFLLTTQYIYNAVLGDLYLKKHENSTAEGFLEQAYQLTSSQAEKSLITEKLGFLRRGN
jgi:RNA polymerase sigma-70 factor (ECF subfamily)